MVPDELNVWATFRYSLGYPDPERHLRFQALFDDVPGTLPDLRALYIRLFEAGAPQPQCPLLESAYVHNRPPGEIVLENKLFYQHFGLKVDTRAAPDHLLTQLEFLAWLDYCLQKGNEDSQSIIRGRHEFAQRHLAHWLPKALKLAESGGPYARLLAALAEEAGRAARPEAGSQE
jgi:nitrate reductase assembly molybdenum cofactor insertion protein NarJ